MRRMEEEMNKFRSELINRESSAFRKAGSRYRPELRLFSAGGYLTEVTSQELICKRSVVISTKMVPGRFKGSRDF
jgi:hypothetical protein